DAAGELFPIDAAELGAVRQNRLAAGAEPRIGWVEKTAAALGLPGVLLHLLPDGAARGGAPAAVELPGPALIFGPRALDGDAAAVFAFGQALGLLRQRATVLLRIAPDELHALFVAAGVLASGGAAAEAPKDAAVAAQVKALGKTLGRKERKALALQSSRFDFELTGAQDWQRAVLRTADRLGLILCGDIVAAVRAVTGAGAAGPADTSTVTLGRRPAAVDLIRFALGEDYLALRREAGLARG